MRIQETTHNVLILCFDCACYDGCEFQNGNEADDTQLNFMVGSKLAGP